MILELKPKGNCKACLGTGEISSQEEFWGATCYNTSLCDCIIEQIPEGQEDDIIEIVYEDK